MVHRRHTAKTQVPLHERIAAGIRRQLAGGTYAQGDRFPSQNELAHHYRTSSATAREAVALLVQEGALERRFGSGTYVTERRPESFIAVVTELDLAHPAVSPSFMRTIQAIRRELATAGKLSRVYIGHAAPFDQSAAPTAISSPEFTLDLAAGRIEGLVLVSTEPALGYRAIEGRGIPCVHSGNLDGTPYWEPREMFELGVRTLAAHGCQSLGCIQNAVSRTPGGWLDRVEQIARDLSLTTHPEWLVPVPFRHERGDGAEAFRQLWLARPERPDGLLVLDDVLYRDMCPALLVNQLRVPEDLVLVTQANAEDTRPFVPEPIRLLIDNDAIGRAMARNLLLRLRDPQAAPEGVPIPVRVMEPTPASPKAAGFLLPASEDRQPGQQTPW